MIVHLMFNPSRDDCDEIAYRELCPQGAELMDGRLSSCIDHEDPNYVGGVLAQQDGLPHHGITVDRDPVASYF
ncbi:hypothetical protein ACFYR1_53255 [Streptomyces canus]|uniref:hypothetical protein n=1 Tax=Streptomyces canus TaxID=58343 RepID=UPI0036B05AF6